MKYIFFTPIAIAALLCACKSSPKSTATLADTTFTDTTVTISSPEEGIPVDYSTVKVIDTVYVTNAAGADMKQEPDAASTILKNEAYGTPLHVIEVTKDWLGVLEYITRKHQSNNRSITTTRWEKLYVNKRMTGRFTDVKLLTKDLNIITLLNHNNKTETYPDGKPLNKYFEIELIDKALFEEKKLTAVEHLLSDTNTITKVNGVITLPCTQKNKVYKDNVNGEEDTKEYKYCGQIEALNKYIVTGSYWESWDCKLIDKVTSKETVIGSIPYLSPDMKYMICIADNPYEQSADLELYHISNTQPRLKVSISFKNWMPQLQKENMFWGSDGYLYVPVLHSSVYWNTNGDLNVDNQYIRIKIKS